MTNFSLLSLVLVVVMSALLAPVVTWFSKTLWLYLGRDVRMAVVRFFTKRSRERRRRRREQEAQR